MPMAHYRLEGTVGHVGTPILHLNVFVKQNGVAGGHAEIEQVLPPPNNPIVLAVTGTVYPFAQPPAHHVIELDGTYLQPFGPPPLIGAILEHFHAVLSVIAVGNQWDGHGTFKYGPHTVSGAPVKLLKF